MELERRARVHAALGEPVRLAMADLLTVSDASPGELGKRLRVPTNLMAHHLRTLADAGVICRVQSEGDRRRSYVQLCLDDDLVRAIVTARPTQGLLPSDQTARVVFVCTHNSARSQLAAAAWRRLSRVPVTSAGTHPADRVHPRTVVVGRRHGLRMGRAQTVDVATVLRVDDLVVAVCDNAHEELAATATRASLHWSIPDPVRVDTDEAFDAAYAQISTRVDRLVNTFANKVSPSPTSTP